MWRCFLLVITLCLCAHYLAVGWVAVGNLDNDAAYYYGVARHIATTGRYEEPIIWQYLNPPATLIHRPFDYWQGLTALLLVPWLALFGATHHVALVTMAVISSLGLLAFYYLIVFALPLRHAWVQLIALLVFALSPSMAEYRFDTETIVVSQLILISWLIAFSGERYLAGAVLAFLLVWARGDGIPMCLMLWVISAGFLLRNKGPSGRQRLVQFGLLAAALCGVYFLVNWISFRALTPPGTQVAPFLSSPWEMYSYGQTHTASPQLLLSWFRPSYLFARLELAIHSLREIPFVSHATLWYLLALSVLVYDGVRRRISKETVLVFLLFSASFVVTWLSGAMFHGRRTLGPLFPLVVLAGALGLDRLSTVIVSLKLGPRTERLRTMVAAIGVLVLGVAVLHDLRPYRKPRARDIPFFEQGLAALDSSLAGRPVAADCPWFVAANTHSPVIKIPDNDDGKIAVFDRYHIDWLITMRDPWPLPNTTGIGRFTIRFEQEVSGVKLYRLMRPDDPDLIE